MKFMVINLLSLTAVAISAFAGDPAITDGCSNGRAWNGMATPFKFVYLVGLADGLHSGKLELQLAIFKEPNSEEAATAVLPNLLPPGQSLENMIVALDLFYRNPLNLDIPIPAAARHYRYSVVSSADKKELEDRLRTLRMVYKGLKELRDGK